MNPFEEFALAIAQGEAIRYLNGLIAEGSLENTFPDLWDCYLCEGGKYHNETVFEHMCGAYSYACKMPWPHKMRFAAMLHDIGKPMALRKVQKETPGKVAFYRHEMFGADIADAYLKLANITNPDRDNIVTLIRMHMIEMESNPKDKTVRRWLYRLGRANWPAILYMREADKAGNMANYGKAHKTPALFEFERRVEEMISSNTAMFPDDLKISRDELVNIVTAEKLDDVYLNLMNMVNTNPGRNTPDVLREAARKISANTTR